MQKLIELSTRILLALPMIIFGLNKFFWFAPVPPPAGQSARDFLTTMFSSYLGSAVGATEVIGGLLLLFPRTAFVGLLLLAPIIFNIAVFHFAYDFIGNGIWLLPTILYVVVAYFYREKYQSLIK
jgi:putative oxidoreductase